MVDRCPICDCGELFTQREFHQRTGIIIALIGASFAHFTRFVSLVLAMIICAILYFNSRKRLVCYQCRSQVVGHRPTRARRRFDPRIADSLKRDSEREPKPRDSHREIL